MQTVKPADADIGRYVPIGSIPHLRWDVATPSSYESALGLPSEQKPKQVSHFLLVDLEHLPL